jgi:hypothetical protein
MGKHRFRLLVCGIGCLALIVASTLLLDWFHASIVMDGVDLGLENLRIDLRSLHVCDPSGVCGSVPLSKLKGFYSSCAQTSFWGSLLFGGLVAFQVGTRILSGFASERFTRIGYALGTLMLSTVFAAGYLFQPESTTLADGGIEFHRTWAPLLLLVAYFFGYVALALSVSSEVSEDDVGEYKPVTIPGKTPSTPGATKLKPVTSSIPAQMRPAPKRTSIPDEISSSAAEDAPTTIVTGKEAAMSVADLGAEPSLEEPPARRPTRASTQVGKVAAAITREQLRKKLLYATAIANVTDKGIEAKREDGLAKRVRWHEVVGVVARRLPAQPPYDGITFVDVVSTAGATLRILPWTRLSGEAIDGEDDGEDRARSFVQLVVVHCPDVHLDPATRTFLGSHGHAAQLPDAETLAAHDARLA